MVDVVDSKSTAGDSVPVRVWPPAPKQYNPNQIFPVGNGFGLFVYFKRYEQEYFPNCAPIRPHSKPRGPRKKDHINKEGSRCGCPLFLCIQFGPLCLPLCKFCLHFLVCICGPYIIKHAASEPLSGILRNIGLISLIIAFAKYGMCANCGNRYLYIASHHLLHLR